MELSVLSVVPALLTIGLAIATKDVLVSLLVGILSGCLILSQGNPVSAMIKMHEITMDRLTDASNLQVVLIVVLLGGLIGLMAHSGSSDAFTKLLIKKIKTRKGVLTATWLMSILLFFDDYFSALLTGSVMRPVGDQRRISHERLSYSLDSTGVGICLLSPVSSWVAFITALIADGLAKTGSHREAFQVFIQTIPYNYYAWLSIALAGLTIFLSDFGPMAIAEKRAMETGVTCEHAFNKSHDKEDAVSFSAQAKGKASDFVFMLAVLILSVFVFLLYTGGFFQEATRFQWRSAVENANGSQALMYAVSLTIVTAVVACKLRGLSQVKHSVSAVLSGVKTMVFVVVLLVFAWVIGGVCEELRTGAVVASVFNGAIPGCFAPVLLFLLTGAIALSTGASWGGYAIMIPVAITLSAELNMNLASCLAAVIGGGGFGAHCSPLADNVIVSAAGAGISHLDHVKTQVPYAALCASAAAGAYILAGFLKSPLVPAISCALLFAVMLLLIRRLLRKKRRQR